MSQGLYSVAQVARYLVKRPQEVSAMVERDGLPALTLPGDVRTVRKFTLHGLHGWLKSRHTGATFMSVDELAAEIAAANAPPSKASGMLELRAATEIVFETIKAAMVKSEQAVSQPPKRRAKAA